MNSTKQLYINIDNEKLEAISLNDIDTSVISNISVSKTLPLVVSISRYIFTNDYIVEKVGYSRQTISYIHNNRYTRKQALRYITIMLPLLTAVGYKKSELIETIK